MTHSKWVDDYILAEAIPLKLAKPNQNPTRPLIFKQRTSHYIPQESLRSQINFGTNGNRF